MSGDATIGGDSPQNEHLKLVRSDPSIAAEDSLFDHGAPTGETLAWDGGEDLNSKRLSETRAIEYE